MPKEKLRSNFNDIRSEKIENAFSYLSGNHFNFPAPITVHYALTSRCHSLCKHCGQWKQRPKRELALDEIHTLFSVLRRWGTKAVTLGGGDPLLHSHFIDVLKLASKHEIETGIITNCSFVPDKSMIEAIAEHSKWIRFSLDGLETSHNHIRGSATYANIINTIRNIKAITHNCVIGLNCVIQHDNISDLEGLRKSVNEIGADFIYFKVAHGEGDYQLSEDSWRHVQSWLNAHKTDTNNNIGELYSYFQDFFTIEDLASGHPVKSFYVNKSIKCFAPLFFLAISSDGDVFPCCMLEYDTRADNKPSKQFILGNIVADANSVLDRLCKVYGEIADLPGSGMSECGACTRFCEFNNIASAEYHKYSADKQSMKWSVGNGSAFF